MKKPTMLEFARKRVPFFPVVPLVPIAFVTANIFALVKLFEKMRRLERVTGIA
ncbi:MAG TPA: hypothetical protein VIF62_26490 [Labilithrix sp.]